MTSSSEAGRTGSANRFEFPLNPKKMNDRSFTSETRRCFDQSWEETMRRIVLALCGLVATTAVAHANQLMCERRAEVMRHLEGEYSEKPIAIGLASNGGIVEVLADGDGSSWTIIVTLPNGMSCLVAEGENWETIPQVALGAKV
jgi:hypothetical protein